MAFTTTLADHYWVVGDTNPTTNVYSTAAVNAYVANNAAAYDTWLNADNYGFITGVTAAASNGGPNLVRLTVFDASNLATGQRWAIRNVSSDANGIRVITKINSTTVDLQGTTYTGAAFTAGTLQGAAIIATDAALRVTLNSYNIGTAVPNAETTSFSSTLALANPLADRVSLANTSAGGGNVTLPRMDATNSIPIGKQIEVRNDGANVFTLKTFGGATLVNLIAPSSAVDIVLTSNATSAGTFLVTTKTVNIFNFTPGTVRGLRATNNAGAPNTKLDVSCILWAGSTGSLRPVFGAYTTHAVTATVDAGLTGPAVNGRDQSGAFSASQWLHVYAIGANSQQGDGVLRTIISANDPDAGGPALPTGYLYQCYLFSVYWDASSHLLPITVRGPLVTYTNAASTGAILSAGSATTETTISLAALVPPVATNYFALTLLIADAGGTRGFSTFIKAGVSYDTVAAPPSAFSYAKSTFPNTGYLAYLVNNAAASGYVTINAYWVPNGDS